MAIPIPPLPYPEGTQINLADQEVKVLNKILAGLNTGIPIEKAAIFFSLKHEG